MDLSNHAAKSGQSGFSLIEVLIAVIILSIGLLGLASLQLAGTKNNQDAYYRSQATMLANDIADRMRANRDSARNGDYETGLGDSAPGGGSIAAQDLTAWKDRLDDVLPAGQGAIDLGSDNTVEIIIQWDERVADESGDNTIQFRTDTRL